MIRVVVTGVAGRMGQRLAALTIEGEGLELVAGVEAPGHEAVGSPVSALVGGGEAAGEVVDDLEKVIAGADVTIAFTAPAATVEHAAVCARHGCALVAGTTGMSADQLAEFNKSVGGIACVFAPNFSTAMNVLFKLVEEAARILGDDYDVEVVEAHHRHKVDAPSGTALRLAEGAARGLQRNLEEVIVHGREGAVGERTRNEIGMHALRLGDVAGDHSVFFGAGGEYLELRHHATSRDAFAVGAIRAVRFVVDAVPGLYDMGDVLAG